MHVNARYVPTAARIWRPFLQYVARIYILCNYIILKPLYTGREGERERERERERGTTAGLFSAAAARAAMAECGRLRGSSAGSRSLQRRRRRRRRRRRWKRLGFRRRRWRLGGRGAWTGTAGRGLHAVSARAPARCTRCNSGNSGNSSHAGGRRRPQGTSISSRVEPQIAATATSLRSATATSLRSATATSLRSATATSRRHRRCRHRCGRYRSLRPCHHRKCP